MAEKVERDYSQTMAEIERLVKAVEDPERDLASIGADVRKAAELIKWCRAYLRGSEQEITKNLEEE